jgi:TetR/AcrR family transcriptional regulator
VIDHVVKKGGETVPMTDPYKEIPEEKREKILQAAIREFAEKGYEKASTNRIVQNADISKGLLFHYFGNKKNLFLATFDHCMHKVVKAVLPETAKLSRDLFERLLEMGRVKFQLFLKHPLEYQFFMEAFNDVPPDVADEVRKRHERMADRSLPQALDGLDVSRFREDVDPGKAIPLILTALEAVGQQWIKRLQAEPDRGLALLPELMKEMEELVEILKHGVYRRNIERGTEDDPDAGTDQTVSGQ